MVKGILVLPVWAHKGAQFLFIWHWPKRFPCLPQTRKSAGEFNFPISLEKQSCKYLLNSIDDCCTKLCLKCTSKSCPIGSIHNFIATHTHTHICMHTQTHIYMYLINFTEIKHVIRNSMWKKIYVWYTFPTLSNSGLWILFHFSYFIPRLVLPFFKSENYFLFYVPHSK